MINRKKQCGGNKEEHIKKSVEKEKLVEKENAEKKELGAVN